MVEFGPSGTIFKKPIIITMAALQVRVPEIRVLQWKIRPECASRCRRKDISVNVRMNISGQMMHAFRLRKQGKMKIRYF